MGGGDELKEATEKDKYDGKEKDVGHFIRKLFMHCLGKKVQEKLANGEEIIINESSDIELLKLLFNKELVVYQHHSEAGQQRMLEIPVFTICLEEAKRPVQMVYVQYQRRSFSRSYQKWMGECSFNPW